MSFFSVNKNFILEIQHHNQTQYTHSTSNVFQVFNFAEWKLYNSNDSKEIHILKNKENFLIQLKKETQKPFGIIVSSPFEIELASVYANFLYIPGEICRQSDILQCSTQTKLPIFIERGNFLAPTDISRIIEKLGDADIGIIDCGTSNGYSDNFLDPRALSIIQNTGCPFGIHLSDLLSPEGTTYSNRPQWLNDATFIDAFIKVAHAFEVSFYVTKNYGNGFVPTNNIIQKISRKQ